MTEHGMNWVDWLFVGIPILLVVLAALKSQKYVKGVADFISAGRVAGRYVVSVAQGEAGLGLISVVAILEMYYNCGFAVSFWASLTIPISMVLGLVGFCTYRFRETKAMTMGQFFEIRYGKSMRVIAATIQATSGIVNYAIFPAVGARFLIYFLDLPVYIYPFGIAVSTFALCMLCFLGLALLIACLGGQVTIMVTDCVQGLLSYPMYVVIVCYIFYKFSWSGEMLPTLMARAPGESFLNPYDCYNLRDFNIFYTTCGILSMFLGRLSWGGTMGYNGAAKSPHEAKMGGLLGTWRGGLGTMIWILLAVSVFAFLNHQDFAKEAREIRHQLAVKTLDDVAAGSKYVKERTILKEAYKKIPARSKFSKEYKDHAAWAAENTDPYKTITREVLGKADGGKKVSQTFSTIYGQMLVPLAIREMLPPYGITGIFCALMIFLMISTDTTYMHSWGSIIIQDFVVPLRKKAFTPKQQINALRCAIAGVAIFAFFFSLFFAQIDYILMFFAITGAIWSGAGVVITLGLYWKRGTSAGAFTALVSAALIALFGITCQQTWVQHIYPWLDANGLVPLFTEIFDKASRPFHPWVVWEMTPNKFPINSVEIGFIGQVVALLSYVLVSLATCKEVFNMDRMLHRGAYSDGHDKVEEKKPFSFRTFVNKNLLGIDHNYTRGDKILAWSVFCFSFVKNFLLFFALVVIWNAVSPWEKEMWGHYFFIKNFLVVGIIGIITTFWFGIGGTRDLFRLFRDLEAKEDNVYDDGRVVNNMSVADIEAMKKAEGKDK
ncbi:MAG: sodium:panthothenate symporter [Lentisphaeria bacterium]|nr:sodium:panthothenate symporter [Lentisphaeria bacterium]